MSYITTKLSTSSINLHGTPRIKTVNVSVHEGVTREYSCAHDNVMTWKYVPCHWSFLQVIHSKQVDSLHKGSVMQKFDELFVGSPDIAWTMLTVKNFSQVLIRIQQSVTKMCTKLFAECQFAPASMSIHGKPYYFKELYETKSQNLYQLSKNTAFIKFILTIYGELSTAIS